MKTSIITLVTMVAFAAGLRAADATVTLSGVHNCCKSCVKGIEKAVSSVKGATATCDGNNVTITAKNTTDSKKAVAALLNAGYFGEGATTTAGTASEGKSKSVTVEGPHLCCGKCVDAFNKAIKEAGATGSNAEKGSKSVTVDGETSPKEVLAALNKNGFNGKVK
ncbi:MAG TPA: hypothetical protein VGH65_06115 [Verrucomicrobiaceae bacterium]